MKQRVNKIFKVNEAPSIEQTIEKKINISSLNIEILRKNTGFKKKNIPFLNFAEKYTLLIICIVRSFEEFVKINENNKSFKLKQSLKKKKKFLFFFQQISNVFFHILFDTQNN